ncbi:MAG: cytochrome c oxidase assembly protein [Panacagrimonas sp.]|jgi:cytochrome c oxidase assembly protein subunit 11|nr:cytochrome c oxidase assembly protein [Panacagrimonas sp.]MCC2656641.1 cytochrome c oxidase assembly protein [Panacagrimonas sp.]
MSEEAQDGGRKRSSRQHGLRLVVVVVAMFGFGFALGPIYDALCKVTGINGKTSGMQANAEALPAIDTSRWVTVQFITTVNGGRPWEFRPEVSEVRVHPGQLSTVSFHAKNTEGRDLVAQAVPNVAPWNAAKHLRKTECFCFNNQMFKAGESKEMPVRFMIDPALPADVDVVTLSYTFFDVTESAAHKTAPAKDPQQS